MIKVAEVMSLIKLHRIDQARDLAQTIINTESQFKLTDSLDWSGVGQLTSVGLSILLSDIISSTEPDAQANFNADLYDPLHFWS